MELEKEMEKALEEDDIFKVKKFVGQCDVNTLHKLIDKVVLRMCHYQSVQSITGNNESYLIGKNREILKILEQELDEMFD